MILKTLELMPFLTNCYIVGSEVSREGMIVDPAVDADTIMRNVEELGLTIKLVVATHALGDHTGALGEVLKATKAKFAIHPEELQAFRTSWRVMAAALGISEPPAPDQPLKEGDTIELGELKFQVLHTPGHSPGGICLLGDGMVICGDTLFNFGIGRTDFPGGSYAQLMNSIHSKLMVLPDETLVFPGHGPQTTIGRERGGNPFLQGV